MGFYQRRSLNSDSQVSEQGRLWLLTQLCWCLESGMVHYAVSSELEISFLEPRMVSSSPYMSYWTLRSCSATVGTLTRALLVTQGCPCYSRICECCQCRCRILGLTQTRAASRRYTRGADSVLAAFGQEYEFDQVNLRAADVKNDVASILDYDLRRIIAQRLHVYGTWRCSFVLKLFSTLCFFLQKQCRILIKAVVGAQDYPWS